MFGLEATDEQMARVQASLRQRELHFEVQRDWAAAESAPEAKRTEAEAKVEKRVAGWVGHDVDAADVEKLANGEQ